MTEGDIISGSEAAYIEALEALWDLVSDAVESGRIKASPRIILQMVECERLRDKASADLDSH